MPDGTVAAPPRAALFGKLPAHGDFVSRGDRALVRRIDEWLTGQVERLAMQDEAGFGDRLARLGSWCFVLDDDLAGGLSLSHDKVGRAFPMIAVVTGDRAVAESVAALVADSVAGPRRDADAVYQTLRHLAPAQAASNSARGWWRRSGNPADDALGGVLPEGEAFERLLKVD